MKPMLWMKKGEPAGFANSDTCVHDDVDCGGNGHREHDDGGDSHRRD